jgi:hypothetical protein
MNRAAVPVAVVAVAVVRARLDVVVTTIISIATTIMSVVTNDDAVATVVPRATMAVRHGATSGSGENEQCEGDDLTHDDLN